MTPAAVPLRGRRRPIRFADWSFTTAVPNPPPTIPANLTVVGVTDNSVTLAWDPEDPVVGPATFSVYLRHSVHDPKGSGGAVWYTQIGSHTTLPTITITGLTPGLAQTYYVAAMAAGGTSGYGPGINATTTAPQGPPDLFVNGNFQFTVQEPGPVVQTLLVQANTSLTDPTGWVQIGSVLPGSGVFTFTDTNASQFPMRFYRVVSP